MSIFLEVVRADGNAAIAESDIENAVSGLSGYRIIRDGGTTGVALPGTPIVAVLENGILTCQLDYQADVDLVVAALQGLAASIPEAVVQDEEGNEL